ncbi:hypothetical protein NBRC116188_00350 [Oceaniserpentilla sp. 4NH20-0058]|uniref:MBL fold metallo-hydrolase n=1 Tax=Oceaniserpentilla sp. 4NH20-0058 TaxID=3127660 RepID=UPI00310C4A5D
MKIWLLIILISTCRWLYAEELNCIIEPNTPSIRYLGVGAFDIHYQGRRIITDPFYSPQSLTDLITFTPYTSNPMQIKKVLGDTSNTIDGVLVGHGHYDHAADIPAINKYLNQNTNIFASKSTEYIFNSFSNQYNVTGLKEGMFNQWYYIANGFIRIKGFPSEHAPQSLGINLFAKNHDHALDTPPKYIWDWSQGVNITWLVDFLKTPNTESVKERVFIQTSASGFPIGLPDISDQIPVDKVFLAAASFDHVDNYPTGIIKSLTPKKIYLIHWEDIFKPWFESPTTLSLIDFDKLMSNEVLANQANISQIAQPNHCY